MSDSDERPRLEINWVQSAGGALAAVSSAVLLSTFGVAGTLIGAAVGSLVITVGGAVYTYSIKATRQRVATAQTVAAARIGLAQARVREASEEMAEGRPRSADDAAEDLAEAEVDLGRARSALAGGLREADERSDWRRVLRGLPWKRIAAVATAIFVAAMLVILAFELVTGRAVSSYTGGSDPDRRTSIPGLGGGGGSTSDQPGDQPGAPSDEESGLPPQEDPDDAEPSAEPTDEPADPAPSESVDPEPTEVPTPQTSPTP
ncbi:serine/threonine-protein kinase [Nocardioides donggukensis]|uniref:Uncharacterized protein n=1 Tax=Nocardioides donggukensis TaxID=2774019 RepID=A0A927K5S6_9ACTN|nr:hypothetical protein [Nocardioides donggukensis]MBD8869660.1 hypothetical protein [Nocardioides donggukensis]